MTVHTLALAWQGLPYDLETGITYNHGGESLNHRLGRTLQRDPLGYADGMNLYEYMESNPSSGFGGPAEKRRSGDPADGMEDDDGPVTVGKGLKRHCKPGDAIPPADADRGSRQADQQAEVAPQFVVAVVKAEYQIVDNVTLMTGAYQGVMLAYRGGRWVVVQVIKRTTKEVTKEVVEHPGSTATLIETIAGKAKDAAKRCPKAKFGSSTTKEYTKTFFKAHPDLEGKVVVHHAVEQQAGLTSAVSASEMHSLENLRGIPKSVNSEIHLSAIRMEWNAFYAPFIKSGTTPTKEQLLKQASEIDKKYGCFFDPPLW